MKISGDKPDIRGGRGQKSAVDYPLVPSQSGGLLETGQETNTGPRATHDNDLKIVDLSISRWGIMETVRSKWETILILLTIVGSVFLLVSPRFDSLEGRLDSLETKVGENTEAITKLDSKIGAVEAKLGNQFDNLADMMIVAHTDGNLTEAELVEIWRRVEEE